MKQRGRPFEKGNQSSRGRPRGSRNKKILLPRELLDKHAEALMNKAVLQAIKGDGQMLRTLLSYILPRSGDAPLKTGPLPVRTAEDLTQSTEKILEACAAGEITVQQALGLCSIIETRRQTIQTQELDARMRAAEERMPEKEPGIRGLRRVR